MESYDFMVNAFKSHLQLTSNSSAAKHLLGIYTEDQNLAIAGYNLQAKVWTNWITPIEFCGGCAGRVALLENNVIMVGGPIRYSPVNTVTSFNLRTMASTEMIPLQTSRRGHCVAILNGLIYAIGGYAGLQELNSVERWNPASGTWSFVASMKDARFDPGVAVMDGHFYVSGGYGRNPDVLPSVECYDPVENTWRSKAPMKVGRVSHCLAAHKGYLLAIGGCNVEYEDKDEGIPVERYDPRTDIWTTIPCSHVMFGRTRCASLGPDLFIIDESNIYTINSEGSCDNLKLRILAKYTDILPNIYPLEWVAIPFEFRPPGRWIKDTKS